MKYIIILFIITNPIYCKAQSNLLYNEPKSEGKFYVVISDNSSYNKLRNDIIEYTLNEPKNSFLLFKADDLSFDEIKNEINQIINEKTTILSQQYIYLIISGDTSFLKKYIILKSKIFASILYLYPDENNLNLDVTITAQYPNDKEVFPDLIKKLKGYTWLIDLLDIKKNNAIDLNSGVQATSVGINIGGFLASRNNYKTYIPNNFMIYGLHIIKPIRPKLQAKFETNFGIKIPNPEDEIKKQIQSQIDISCYEEQEVIINAKIKGHIYSNLALSFQYFPFNTMTVSPFIGLGISYSNLTTFSSVIDTTMLIEIDGGGPPDQGSLSDIENSDAISTKYNSLEIPLSLGVYLKLSDKIQLSLNSNLQIPLNSSYIYNDGSNYLNYFTFNVGISINFRRKNLFYQYIK